MMRPRRLGRALAGGLSAALALAGWTSLAQVSRARTVAFIDVNVLPMDAERVLTRQTVVVREGKIAEIGGARSVSVPSDALRVEGRGRYLLPGLAEMHGHLPGPNVSEALTQDLLFLFVASGVTTVRGMLGYPNSVSLRDRAARGEFISPTLYVASPGFSGQSVTTVEDAVRRVREYKEAGFDLLKMHEGLSREVFDAVAETAHAERMPFGGHVADRVGLLHAFEQRMKSIDHLDGYLEAMGLDDSPFRDAEAATRAQKVMELADERRISELARRAREVGAWNVPTLALWQTFFGGQRSDAYVSWPEMKYVPRSMLDQWAKTRDGQIANFPPAPEGRKVLAARDKVLKALVDEGAGVVLGSDAPQMFSVPGYSIVLREMPAMIKAGLTPYQVLRSGTRNVAEYFGTLDRTGTVAVGRQADLILLEANPLEDVAHVARRAGVMLRGRWLPAAEIDARLQAIATANASR
jgi:imidazolonepropionase-like amidohydrolase